MTKQVVTKRLPVKRREPEGRLYKCSVIASLKMFATKWKPCILCYLAQKPMRYNTLYRIIPNISRKMLSEHLDELQSDGLIERIQYDAKLQRVEYNLTAKGQSLLPILYQLQDWGMENIDDVLTIQEMVDVTMG